MSKINEHNSSHYRGTLLKFEKMLFVISIILISIFASEIILLKEGYKIVKKVGLIWSFFYLPLRLFTQSILILMVPVVGYVFFKVFKRKIKPKIAIAIIVAAIMNLLAMWSFYAFEKDMYWYIKQTYRNTTLTRKRLLIGKTLPEYAFKEINTNGEFLLLTKNLQGKTTVLIFWATYNAAWSSNFKLAQELYYKRKKLNINVFTIAVDEAEDNVKDYLKKNPTSMPVFYDPNAGFKRQLNLAGPVELIVITDSKGKIANILYSPRTVKEIISILSQIKNKS